LSELLVEIAREPVQVEVSDVRVLLELLGFLLRALVSKSLTPRSSHQSVRFAVAAAVDMMSLVMGLACVAFRCLNMFWVDRAAESAQSSLD
jgi:hypothetical protein